MSLQTTIEPYEFLARFRNGKLSGAHIQNIVVVRDGESVISEHIMDAKPVGSSDFPLSDILDATTKAAMQTYAEQVAIIAERDKTITGLNEQIAELKKAAVAPVEVEA